MKRFFITLQLILIGVAIGLFVQPLISNDNIYEQFKKFQFVFNTMAKNYVDEVDINKAMEAAIEGMLQDLDPHSAYISREEMKKVNEDFKGHYDGIGVEFDIINDTITIIAPLNGGPSEQLGIVAGDKIVQIDGKDAIGTSREEVPKKLKGPKGTIVEVDIKREGESELKHFTIKRDKIPNNSMGSYYMIDKSTIGYISLTRFAETTYDEMMGAAKDLKKQGMTKLILDLRGNPGGYLTQAFRIADEFLPTGNLIVYTKGRKPEFDETYYSTAGGELEDIPVIVMINQGSASASEIVSGALQDLDRGVIVGTTSYGKGLVQRQYEVEDGSSFRLTISRYYTPSGRSIQRPYKDKEQYRSLVGRLELEEGSNFEHALEKIKKDEKAKDSKDKSKINFDSIPIFKSKAGRPLLGGGGITPDFVVKNDTSRLTKMIAKMIAKMNFSIFNEIASEFLLSSEGIEFKEKYKGNYTGYLRNYTLPTSIYKSFRSILESKKIDWVEEDFEKDKDFVDVWIKSTIARIVWDRNKSDQIRSQLDRQLKKAVIVFDEANLLKPNKK